jgi:hypothetical protein
MLVRETDLEKAIVYWGKVNPIQNGEHSKQVARLIELLVCMRFSQQAEIDIAAHHEIVAFVTEAKTQEGEFAA